MKDSGNNVLRSLFILIWIIALTHIVAEFKHLYWSFLWLDVPMHLLGGMWLGLAILWFRNHTHYFKTFWQRVGYHDLVVAIVGGAGIGFVWEMYEYFVWQYTGVGLPIRYVADTRLDITMDIVGAVCGYLLYRYMMRTRVDLKK